MTKKSARNLLNGMLLPNLLGILREMNLVITLLMKNHNGTSISLGVSDTVVQLFMKQLSEADRYAIVRQ